MVRIISYNLCFLALGRLKSSNDLGLQVIQQVVLAPKSWSHRCAIAVCIFVAPGFTFALSCALTDHLK